MSNFILAPIDPFDEKGLFFSSNKLGSIRSKSFAYDDFTTNDAKGGLAVG